MVLFKNNQTKLRRKKNGFCFFIKFEHHLKERWNNLKFATTKKISELLISFQLILSKRKWNVLTSNQMLLIELQSINNNNYEWSFNSTQHYYDARLHILFYIILFSWINRNNPRLNNKNNIIIIIIMAVNNPNWQIEMGFFLGTLPFS